MDQQLNLMAPAAREADAEVLRHIEFHDAGTDKFGRRHYSLHWTDEAGEFRAQTHTDGQPVGLRRAQHFFGVPPIVGQR